MSVGRGSWLVGRGEWRVGLEDIGKPFSGFLEPGVALARGVIDLIALAEVLDADGGVGHYLFDVFD